MRNTLPYFTAMFIVVASGLVAGVRANRWGDQSALTDASAKLERIPLRIGDWEGEPGELPQRIIDQSEVSGYVLRRYRNRRTKADVSIFLGCGRPGPVSAHSPEVCYAGGGYEQAGATRSLVVAAKPDGRDDATMMVADFRNPPSHAGGYLRIFWAMTSTGEWVAPKNPRIAFATSPVLFKLYVYRGSANPAEALGTDPCKELIQQLLPELDKALFGRDGPPSRMNPRAVDEDAGIPGRTGASHVR